MSKPAWLQAVKVCGMLKKDNSYLNIEQVSSDGPPHMTDKTWSEALYQPLPLSGTQLRSRFLRIHPGKPDGRLKCTLFTSTLIGARYEALSYTWGTDAQCNPVIVNKVAVGVTLNLQSALLALRRPSKSRVMWIDALCINQNDLQERSHQVQQMGDIYRCAAKVVIWLGAESDDSGAVFRLMRHNPHELADCLRLPPERNNELPNKHALWVHSGVRRLLDRRYWKRVWIVQEIAQAKSDPILLCGKDELSWTSLSQFVAQNPDLSGMSHIQLLRTIRLRACTPPRLRFVGDQVPSPTDVRASYEDDLFFLLDKTRDFDATDPRDKVFALLSMTRGLSSHVATADYEHSASRVFTDLAGTTIARSESLDVTSYGSSTTTTTDLPTWVPDFASKRVLSIPSIPSEILKRLQGQPAINITNKPSTLHISGTPIDKISGVDIFSPMSEWDKSDQDEELHTPQRFLHWQQTTGLNHLRRENTVSSRPIQASALSDDWTVALFLFHIRDHERYDCECNSNLVTKDRTDSSLRDVLFKQLEVRDFLRTLRNPINNESWTKQFARSWFSERTSDAIAMSQLLSMANSAVPGPATLSSHARKHADAMISLLEEAVRVTPGLDATISNAYNGTFAQIRPLAMSILEHRSEQALPATLRLIDGLISDPRLPPDPCPWVPNLSARLEFFKMIDGCPITDNFHDLRPVTTDKGFKGFTRVVDVQPGDRVVAFNNTSTFKLLRQLALAPGEGEGARYALLGDVYLHLPDDLHDIFPMEGVHHYYSII